jgi:two-component system copper resistance phosphate regulon response regulator CusR
VKVLIVDDDPASKRYTGMALEEAGIQYKAVDCAPDARAVLDGAEGATFDVLLLDVELPGTKGWEFLSDLRSEGVQIPVIFVTVRESLEDRVQGLNLGADDYIVKPFEFSELVARLRAVLRRTYRGEPLLIGDLSVDPQFRRVERKGHPIDLTPREFDVLWILAQAAGRPVSQKEILARVWAIDFDTETKHVEVHVHRLRKKIEAGGRIMIETVWGEGYRLLA